MMRRREKRTSITRHDQSLIERATRPHQPSMTPLPYPRVKTIGHGDGGSRTTITTRSLGSRTSQSPQPAAHAHVKGHNGMADADHATKRKRGLRNKNPNPQNAAHNVAPKNIAARQCNSNRGDTAPTTSWQTYRPAWNVNLPCACFSAKNLTAAGTWFGMIAGMRAPERLRLEGEKSTAIAEKVTEFAEDNVKTPDVQRVAQLGCGQQGAQQDLKVMCNTNK